MAGLLRRFAQRLPSLPEEIRNMYKQYKKEQKRPSLAEHLRLLHNVAPMFSQAFLLVDALDECKEDDGARQTLLLALKGLSASFRIVVTSRWLPAIENSFREALKLEICADNEDVAEYVRSKIAQAPRLMRHLQADPILGGTISRKIVDHCHGMFLMAKLHMDSITKQPHRRALRLALDNLPPELDDTYNDALARIDGQDKEDTKMAHHVLGWITHATRPLTMKQLQQALSVEPEQADLDEETLIDEELLISKCLGLVTIDTASDEVRLVHYTAQKYFEHRLLEIFPDYHLHIASTCLTYMSFKNCREIDESTSDEDKKAFWDRYALLDYAGYNWGLHAQRDDRKLLQQMLRFLSPEDTYLSSRMMLGRSIWRYESSGYKHLDYPVKYEGSMSGHNMAAYFGLQHTLMALLSEASDLTDMLNSALLICSAKDYRALVQLLPDHNANVNIYSWLGYTPLHLAVNKGSLAMTKLLLERNADVNKRPTPSLIAPLPLMAEDLVSLTDTIVPTKYTTLRLAVFKGELAFVNVLLNGGADINALHLINQRLSNPVETKHYQTNTTVLFDAVHQQQEDIVNSLLDRGANIDMGDITPLYRAVADSNGRMVSLLIERGANLLIPGASQHFLEKGLWYPSSRAFSDESLSKSFLGQVLVAVADTLESESLAETLINSGADIKILSINEERLDFSGKNGDERLLHNTFERVNLHGPLLDFALLAAWRNGKLSLVRLLLGHGAKMWGVEKEIWLQQAMTAKPKAEEPLERSYPQEDFSRDPLRVIYRKMIDNDDFREILRKNTYSERRMRNFNRIARRIEKHESLAAIIDFQKKRSQH